MRLAAPSGDYSLEFSDRQRGGNGVDTGRSRNAAAVHHKGRGRGKKLAMGVEWNSDEKRREGNRRRKEAR